MLGPLELRGPDGTPVPLPSGRQRRLLTALALWPGRHVPGDTLVELVWGDDLPADPQSALQTNVARLRRALPEGIAVVTERRGYRLALDRGVLDATAFEDAISAGRLDEALALWRGAPFTDLDAEAAAVEAARLHELWAAAVERRAQQRAAAGQPQEAVAALEELIAAEPLRESAVAVLMEVLAAAGRQADALRAFSRLRRALAEELGIEPSAALRATEERVLLQDIPPAGSPGGPVPLPVSSFVGRDTDVGAVRDLVDAHRIVTLCGPGGVGKTRLALQVAHETAAGYPDGVVLVDLGEATTPEAVDARLSAALRVAAPAGGSLRDHVVDVLRPRRALLLLDNCEHVVEPVATLVEQVTMASATVDVLATSREPLRVDGEHVMTVGPLPLASAVALLRDRVAAAAPAALDLPGADEALVEIATRLDGLPLALELAAGRARALALDGLVAALDESLAVLQAGRRTAAPRHRSLRDVVGWSYDLLTAHERHLFDCLGVFAGPVDAAAVATVCGAPGVPGPPAAGIAAVRPLLADLVDRSLVTAAPGPSPRYGMLATVRAFARERLAGSQHGAGLRDRHARWVAALVDGVGVGTAGPDEPAALARFDAHGADIARAVSWMAANERLDDLLRVGVVVGSIAFETMRGDLAALVDVAVTAVGDAVHPLVPPLLGTAATLAWQRGDAAGCEDLCARARALASRLGPETARHEEQAAANLAFFRGDLDAAAHHSRRASELAAAAGDRALEAAVVLDLALVEAYAGDPRAADDLARGTALAEALGSPRLRGWAAYTAGESLVERDPAAAVPHLERAVALAAEVGAAFLGTVARHTLLTSAGRAGAVGLDAYGRLVDDWHRAGAWTQLWVAVRALAEALGRRGRHDEAVRLLAAHEASKRALPAHGPDAERLSAVLAAARAALGEAGCAAAWEAGARLDDDAAVDLVRSVVAAARPEGAHAPGA